MTRILLVEDHVAFSQALAKLLGKEPGFEVVAEVGTLSEARRVLAEEVELVVLDLRLPDGDGATLLCELGPHTKVTWDNATSSSKARFSTRWLYVFSPASWLSLPNTLFHHVGYSPAVLFADPLENFASSVHESL
jgi:response regulator RpfG family c-di-GMP phosphodiesterase